MCATRRVYSYMPVANQMTPGFIENESNFFSCVINQMQLYIILSHARPRPRYQQLMQSFSLENKKIKF